MVTHHSRWNVRRRGSASWLWCLCQMWNECDSFLPRQCCHTEEGGSFFLWKSCHNETAKFPPIFCGRGGDEPEHLGRKRQTGQTEGTVTVAGRIDECSRHWAVATRGICLIWGLMHLLIGQEVTPKCMQACAFSSSKFTPRDKLQSIWSRQLRRKSTKKTLGRKWQLMDWISIRRTMRWRDITFCWWPHEMKRLKSIAASFPQNISTSSQLTILAIWDEKIRSEYKGQGKVERCVLKWAANKKSWLQSMWWRESGSRVKKQAP